MRSSSIEATPFFLIFCFIIIVAIDSMPGSATTSTGIGTGIGIAGLASGLILIVRQVLAQQLQAVEREEDLDLVAQRGGGRGEDERRVGHVERALGRDDGHLLRLVFHGGPRCTSGRGEARAYFFFRKKTYSLPCSAERQQRVAGLLGERLHVLDQPGSVEIDLQHLAGGEIVSAFLVLRIGSGQDSPRASSSLSKFMAGLLG